MSKQKSLLDLNEKQTRESTDDYEFTCQTTIVMKNILEYNFQAKCSQGKKMLTTGNNLTQKKTEVTPDLVIESSIQNGKKGYREVNEIKVDLPKDQTRWKAVVEQLNTMMI
jgi:hypothetical protein